MQLTVTLNLETEHMLQEAVEHTGRSMEYLATAAVEEEALEHGKSLGLVGPGKKANYDLYKAEAVNKAKYEAKKAIAAFEGQGPNGQLNFSYQDHLAGASIVERFGTLAGTDSISGIKAWAHS